MKELKNKVWDLIESNIENASNEIGWGSMDSMCEELIQLIKEDNKCKSCNTNCSDVCGDCVTSIVSDVVGGIDPSRY